MLKFQDPLTTAKGETRAFVDLSELKTLWFNSGTLCNLECKNCYIESSPKNDRLSYITKDEVAFYLDEIKESGSKLDMIGITGGEPFLNPEIIPILESILDHGHEVLVLTNANRVLKRHQNNLLRLKDKFQNNLKLRISLDHHTKEIHDQERGSGAFDKTMEQLVWLYKKGFDISLASRSLINEAAGDSKQMHAKMLKSYGIEIDLEQKLVVFPEMKSDKDVPEITTACWGILAKRPEDQMCATERMIVKRKQDKLPSVMPCTLLAYDDQFVLGTSLSDSSKRVQLNHKFCAEFCVLGGASCSSAK